MSEGITEGSLALSGEWSSSRVCNPRGETNVESSPDAPSEALRVVGKEIRLAVQCSGSCAEVLAVHLEAHGKQTCRLTSVVVVALQVLLPDLALSGFEVPEMPDIQLPPVLDELYGQVWTLHVSSRNPQTRHPPHLSTKPAPVESSLSRARAILFVD